MAGYSQVSSGMLNGSVVVFLTQVMIIANASDTMLGRLVFANLSLVK